MWVAAWENSGCAKINQIGSSPLQLQLKGASGVLGISTPRIALRAGITEF
jgi:hypothetical protein